MTSHCWSVSERRGATIFHINITIRSRMLRQLDNYWIQSKSIISLWGTNWNILLKWLMQTIKIRLHKLGQNQEITKKSNERSFFSGKSRKFRDSGKSSKKNFFKWRNNLKYSYFFVSGISKMHCCGVLIRGVKLLQLFPEVYSEPSQTSKMKKLHLKCLVGFGMYIWFPLADQK